MSKYQCPICGRELKMNHKIVYADYYCTRHSHFYSIQVVQGAIVKEKIRVVDNGSRLYIKLNYDEGNMQVWREGVERITVDTTFKPDCSDLTSLRDKIKTYLVFG